MTHYFSGKMIFRETSFRENDYPGKRLSGNRLSGKVTFRETSVNRLRHQKKWETNCLIKLTGKYAKLKRSEFST